MSLVQYISYVCSEIWLMLVEYCIEADTYVNMLLYDISLYRFAVRFIVNVYKVMVVSDKLINYL